MALLPAVYRMARPFLTAMVLAAILAVLLDPLQRRVGRLITRSSVAALITTLVAIGPILAILVLAGVIVSREIKSGAFADILRTGEQLTAGASIDRHALQEALPELNQVAGGLFTCALAVLFLYVLLVHGHAWVAQLTALLPLDSSVTKRILSTVRDAIVANVDGILAVSAAEAILYGIVFWVAGIGSPAMWGAIAGLASMLPIVGGMAVWLPMAVILAIHGAYVQSVDRWFRVPGQPSGGGVVTAPASGRDTAPAAATAHCALGVGRHQCIWCAGHSAGTRHHFGFGGACAGVSNPTATSDGLMDGNGRPVNLWRRRQFV